ncbi:MAG: cation transporter [Marmoricola sp.]|nr:cation transporter [Marmoricola sp.]
MSSSDPATSDTETHGKQRDGQDHDGYEHHSGWLGALVSVFRPHSHDTADSIDSELASSARGIRVLVVSLCVLLVTGLLQAVVAWASGSVALLADTVHNLADAFTAVPLGFAFWLGRRPATRRFNYGFGRAEDLAGVFIVVLIAASALFAGWEAVRRLLDPVTVEHIWWVAAAGLIGFAGNELVAIYRIRVGRAIGSAALVADGVHARTDGITSLAVVAGAFGVALGFPLADPLVGLLITIAITTVMWGAARDVFGRLMDAVDPDLVEDGRTALAETAGVRAVGELRLRWSGHRLLADAVVEVDPGLSVSEGHAVAHRAEENLTSSLPKVTSVVIHAQPCGAHELDAQTLTHRGLQSRTAAEPCGQDAGDGVMLPSR